jgi:hypothetical protein
MRGAVAMNLCLLLAPVGASACVSFGADTKAVDKVQSSWDPAERLTSSGDYATAVKELEATARFLPSIKNAFIRGCVAGGSNIRIVSAKAGESYLSAHAGDLAGAKHAADVAWKSYPQRHDCP